MVLLKVSTSDDTISCLSVLFFPSISIFNIYLLLVESDLKGFRVFCFEKSLCKMVTPEVVDIYVHSVIFIHACSLLYFSPLRAHLSTDDLYSIAATQLVESIMAEPREHGKITWIMM